MNSSKRNIDGIYTHSLLLRLSVLHYLFCIIISTLLWFSSPVVADHNAAIVQLRNPPQVPHGLYVQDVLEMIYERIDYKVEFLDIPGTRELQMGSDNQLSGVLARDVVIETTHPDLVRVDVPLFSYQLILVADRRQCGYCDLDQIESVVTFRGGEIYQDAVKRLPDYIESFQVSSTVNIEQMLLKQRVNAAIMSDIGISDDLKNNPHFIVRTLETRFDYHYLNKQHANLIPLLERELNILTNSGKLLALRKEFGIHKPKVDESALPNQLIAVTENWFDVSEVDGTGVYWEFLDLVVGDEISVIKDASTWNRAVTQMKAQKADVLVGAYQDDPAGFLRSQYHIDYEYEVIAVGRNIELLEQFITGKKSSRVCVTSAFDSALEQVEATNQLYKSDLFSCVKLFEKKRVDIVLEYPYNLDQLTENYPWQTFYQSAPLFFMFQDSAQGRAIKTYFDSRMRELAKTGALRSVFPTAADYRHAKIR